MFFCHSFSRLVNCFYFHHSSRIFPVRGSLSCLSFIRYSSSLSFHGLDEVFHIGVVTKDNINLSIVLETLQHICRKVLRISCRQ